MNSTSTPLVPKLSGAQHRLARGLGKPETFSFLGFTPISAKTRKGRFMLKRVRDSKRMRAKYAQSRPELMQRRHLPIPV